MKRPNKTASAILTALVFILIGLVFRNNFNDDIGKGKNADMRNFPSTISAKNNGSYGDVVHSGTLATRPVISAARMADGVTAVYFINKDKVEPSVITLICTGRHRDWSVAHNVVDELGQGVGEATEISIMNYRKGVIDIRESDEVEKPVFSTAEGDMYIIGGLRNITKLDPESTIAFTLETVDDLGHSTTRGWSALFRVKDVVAGLKEVDLTDCEEAEIGEYGVEIHYRSTEEIRNNK